MRKEGPSFDLPIALGMLKLEENNRLPDLDAFCISGELALSGQLRPVKGVLSIALEARRRHRQTLIVPLDNSAEAAVVEGVEVYGVSSLSEVVHFLRGDISLAPMRATNGWSARPCPYHQRPASSCRFILLGWRAVQRQSHWSPISEPFPRIIVPNGNGNVRVVSGNVLNCPVLPGPVAPSFVLRQSKRVKPIYVVNVARELR